MAKIKKLTRKKLEEFINSLFSKHAKPVDVFDIGKVLDAGRAGYMQHEDPVLAAKAAEEEIVRAFEEYGKE